MCTGRVSYHSILGSFLVSEIKATGFYDEFMLLVMQVAVNNCAQMQVLRNSFNHVKVDTIFQSGLAATLGISKQIDSGQ